MKRHWQVGGGIFIVAVMFMVGIGLNLQSRKSLAAATQLSSQVPSQLSLESPSEDNSPSADETPERLKFFK